MGLIFVVPHQQQKFSNVKFFPNYSMSYVHMLLIIYSLTGGRTLFIANTSTLLKTAQLYEFQAETSQDKERYACICQICKTMI